MQSFHLPCFSDWSVQAPEAPRPSAVMPHFAYTEIFQGGAVYRGISAGRGKFIAVDEMPPAVAFAVAKDRSQQTITIEIKSGSLGHTISNALGIYFGAASSQSPDLGTLLDSYGVLKRHLETLHSLLPGHPEILEFRLLVEDLLQDRAIFDGLGLEQPSRLPMSQAQLRDLHERSIDTGLDVLDDTFRLGILPFDVTEDTMRALSARYAQTALPDGLAAPDELYRREITPGSPARHDPLFPSGAEPERPASYQSFSNLALRIKGLRGDTDLEPPPPSNTADSVGRYFKAGSPLRPDDSLGVDNGIFTSLSALENAGVSDGLRGTTLSRKASPFYTGMGIGPAGPTMGAEPDDDYSEYFTSRSEGIPEIESEPVFLGARDAVLPAASLPTTSANGFPGVGIGFAGESLTTEGKSTHLLRQRLGRDLVASLTSLCRTVRDVIGQAEAGSLESSVSAHFASFIRVWSEGVGVFRRVISNHPPRGLVEVLDCLVVASAMCTAVGSCSARYNGSMYFEFVNDLGRWRSLLSAEEHPLFDRIALALWLSIGLSDPVPERADKEGLAKFHGLIQDLVTLQDYPLTPAPVPYATRLSAVQREYIAREEQTRTQSDPISIPIPGGARKRVFDEALDAEDDDGFSISDVFDVEGFLAQSVGDGSEAGEVLELGWNDILSTTVLVLASTAFSVFLTLTTVMHRDFDADSTLGIWRRPAGYARSCEVLGSFVESVGGVRGKGASVPLYGARSLDQGIGRLSLSTMSAPPAGSLGFGDLRTRARASVVFGPHPQTSHSLGADHPIPQPRRLRCQSAGCQKTFSSVSNRNKHMREGCQRGGGERAGYRCRVEGCARVLTTKWYRNRHEVERCRFRGRDGGA